LQALHLLSRASGFVKVAGGPKARLVVDPALRRQWDALNPTERYFNLFETFAFFIEPGMLGSVRLWPPTPIFSVLKFWEALPAAGTLLDQCRQPPFSLFRLHKQEYLLALMDLFGVLAVEHPPEPAARWKPVAVHRTPFGDALLSLIAPHAIPYLRGLVDDPEDEDDQDEGDDEDDSDDSERPHAEIAPLAVDEDEDEYDLDEDDDEDDGDEGGDEDQEDAGEDDEDEDEPEIEFGKLQEVVEPYFPEWCDNLVVPEPEPFVGECVFRVSIEEASCLLAMPAGLKLEDFAEAILEAFGDTTEYVYMFTYLNDRGGRACARHRESQEGPYADLIEIRALPLRPGFEMEFFTVPHPRREFGVVLVRLDDASDPSGTAGPRVLERRGASPGPFRS
jgi:hypothetical protein